MTPSKRTYHTKFVFTLKAILPDLEGDARLVREDLAKQGYKVSEGEVLMAWVIYLLERHLFLHLEMNADHARAQNLIRLIGPRFFHQHPHARDLLLAQIRPVLTHRESVPYTDRICRPLVRLPDLQLHFL